MNRTLVWDLPVRLFHWLLAGGFFVAALISLGFGEHSPLFPYHAIIGFVLAVMVVLRVLWGLIGSRHARFSSFAFGPAAAATYLKHTLVGGGARHAGHNPGSAYAIFAMLLLVLGLAGTGFMLGRGNEGVKDIHEVLAYALLAVSGVHVLGVLFHWVRLRENLTAGMIHGRKDVGAEAGISSARPAAAAVFLVLTAAWAAVLLRNYDAATQSTRVPVLGVRLQLGEPERDEPRGAGREHDSDGDDD